LVKEGRRRLNGSVEFFIWHTIFIVNDVERLLVKAFKNRSFGIRDNQKISFTSCGFSASFHAQSVMKGVHQ